MCAFIPPTSTVFSSKMTVLLLLLSALTTVYGQSIDAYTCSLCTSVVQEMKVSGNSLPETCAAMYPSGSSYCEHLETSLLQTGKKLSLTGAENPARSVCEEVGLCESLRDESWRYRDEVDSLDLHVSKGYGGRGYDKVRVSVISNKTIDSKTFTYSHPFKYRWTDNVLNTGIVTIKPGQKTAINVGEREVDIFIPEQGEGTRGVIIADPCMSSEFIVCLYKKPYDIFDHLTSLLNAINSHDDNHFWMILGDNFYDQVGENTRKWFSALSVETKSKVMATVPGNHDFWVKSSPKVWNPEDQLGNGFMQYYGQDVAASFLSANAMPYDFSVDPDQPEPNAYNIPPASNFFFYNMIGNIAFIGFSGAQSYDETENYLVEACEWASQPDTNPSVILLLGHWDKDGSGCDSDMTVPGLLDKISSIPKCSPLIKKFKYFEGHTHCNQVMENDIGFMVGAMGMGPSVHCSDDFGIPVIDSTGGQFKVYYFPISKFNGYDNYDATLSCFQENGVSGCYHLADVWSFSTL